MLLRRVTKHVKEQNWVAVGIDFIIVVVGVFIGIQVANWNDARADNQKELTLLKALRVEVSDSIIQTNRVLSAYNQVAESGTRAIDYLDKGETCEQNCVSILVDFFHASQWQQFSFNLPTYEQLLRNGWPQNRDIFMAANGYMRRVTVNSAPFSFSPAYRNLVRGLIPLPIHQPYWSSCFNLVNGEEVYVYPCEIDVSNELAVKGLKAIAANPEVYRTIVDWTGYVQSLGTLLDQQEAAQQLLNLIDAELKARAE